MGAWALVCIDRAYRSRSDTAAAPAAVLVLLAATAAGGGEGGGGGGGGGLSDVARCSRRARAGICSAFASNPVCQHDVFQFEMTPCFVVCRLFFIRHVQFL